MKILFVTPRLPLPADTGAKIRTFNLMKNVAKDHQVSLLSFCYEKEDADVCLDSRFRGNDKQCLNDGGGLQGIKTYFIKGDDRVKPSKIFSPLPVSIEKYRSKEMTKKLKEFLANEKFDLVHFDHLHMGQYKEYVHEIPCVLDEHNVESVILERCAAIEKNPLKRILFKSQAKKMARFEGELVTKFSKCFVVSESDKQDLYELSGRKANIEVITNGVDTGYFKSPSHQVTGSQEENSLVFTGSMDWLPNNDAVVYFCKEILPLIWDKNNGVKFYVVGKNPTKEMVFMAKKDNRIIVTGAVEDVRPYVAKSKVFVVPIRIGGGTRLKILEAMSMEKPVISTSIGAEGIAYTDKEDILIRDTAEGFANAVVSLLENQSERERLGRNGGKLVTAKYDWNIIGDKLNALYRSMKLEK